MIRTGVCGGVIGVFERFGIGLEKWLLGSMRNIASREGKYTIDSRGRSLEVSLAL